MDDGVYRTGILYASGFFLFGNRADETKEYYKHSLQKRIYHMYRSTALLFRRI